MSVFFFAFLKLSDIIYINIYGYKSTNKFKIEVARMSDNKKSISKEKLISAIVMVIIGILCISLRSGMVNILFTIVGALLICAGIIELFNKNYAAGAVEIAVGIVFIACGWTIANIALLIVGIVAVVYSIYMVAKDFDRIKQLKGWDIVRALLGPIGLLVVGILLIVAGSVVTDAIFIVLGVFAIIDGILMLVK